jgi:hypothetical protein
MMTEERTRFEVLLENIETKVNVIAEGHAGLHQRLDQMEARFEARFDSVETQLNVLAVKVNGLETKVDGLEVFAADAQRRLKRIESSLQLKSPVRSAPRHSAVRATPPKRRRKQ